MVKATDLGIPPAQVELLKPRYNIAPSQQVAAILVDGTRHLEPLRWGLVPSWAKDEAIGNKMINARAETLAEKPSFKGLLNKHRCLILADGFYEWMETGRGKQPYFIHMKNGEPFTFAGLWSHWLGPKGQEIRTCAIITCPPNKLMERIHNRMPVILSDEAREVWIDPLNTDGSALTPLLRPYPEREMEAYAVSKTVNSPANDRLECLAPSAF
jgi:putative SOS response-associated peptidase YedK